MKVTEFVRRWTTHILPKGFTRSRSYGGYHGTKRTAYLDACRQLLGIADDDLPSTDAGLDAAQPSGSLCPRCEVVVECIRQPSRPSWKKAFERGLYADPSIYSSMHHIHGHRHHPHAVEGYG